MAAETANVLARDELNTASFNAVMERGLNQAKAGDSRPASEVFSELRRRIGK